GADNGTHYEKGEECDPVEGKPILQAIYDMSSEIEQKVEALRKLETEFRTRPEVKELEEQIYELRHNREFLLMEARGKGVNAQVAGKLTYVLKVKTRKVREVIPVLFANKFGLEIFAKVASIPVGKAEEVVGKDGLADVVSVTEIEGAASVEIARGSGHQ
ncbi:MAG: hypothetical protein WC683_05210, partial [bacterium]